LAVNLAVVVLTFAIWVRSRLARSLRTGWTTCAALLIVGANPLLRLALGWDRWLLALLGTPGIALLVAAVARWHVRGVRRVPRLLKRRDLDTALTVATRLVERQPRSAGMRYLLGSVHFARHEWPAAIEAFRAAERLGQSRNAIAAFDDLPSSPFATSCQARIGLALWRSGRPAAARPLLEEVRSALPKEPFFALQLCALLLDLGQAADAAAELRRVEEIGKLPPALAEQRDALRARLEGQA